jgi:hypothetical protein
MTLKLVEESSGIGELLHHGELVRRVRYRVSIYQTTLGPGGLPVPGLHRIEGSIEIDGGGDASNLVGTDLALKLVDGRHLGIRLTDRNGRVESCRHGSFSGCSCC